MKREYGSGTNDFKKLISEGAFFLDKSMLVREFIRERCEAVLITRPGRFGKSLNMSMLRYFLDIKEESRALFNELAISRDAESMAHINKYPVIYLSFKGIEDSNLQLVTEGIQHVMAEEYRRHSEVKSVLDESELVDFEAITSKQSELFDLRWSLLELSRYLERYYKKRVVILIDEYDSPAYSLYGKEGFEEVMEFFEVLYENAMKGNVSLENALMTGIMRAAKGSIFSGFNNVIVHTIFSKKYREYFGFTEDEIKPLIEEAGLSTDEAKAWYNGYNFGGNLVYNPWSVMNYLRRKETGLYWDNRSNNYLIMELVKAGGPEIKYGFELLLKGEELELEIRENADLDWLGEEDVWSLLLQAGYLTYEDREGKRFFKLPNKEVGEFIFRMLKEVSEITESKDGVKEALDSEDWKRFEEELRKSVLRSVSYYNAREEGRRYKESFYYSLLLGMLITMEEYEVRSNIEEGLGRASIVLKRKDGKGAVIIELKAGNQFYEIERLLERAEEQMREKRYGEDLEGPITRLAIAFRGKEMAIKKL